MGPPIPEIQFDLESQRSRWKTPCQCSIQLSHFLSVSHQVILSTPVPLVPWQSGLPFPWYNLTLKVKGQGQRYPSQRSVQLTHFLSVSDQVILSTTVPFVPWQPGLPFPCYNLTLKVKNTPVSAASSWLISLVFYIRASYQLPSFLFHNNWASHSPDTIWPWKFKVKGQGQRYPSQRSIQLTHFLFVSHQLDQLS